MSYAYHVAQESPLKVILGLAGLTIDAIVSDERSRLLIKEFWLYHSQITNMIERGHQTRIRKSWEYFYKTWPKWIEDARTAPKGGLMTSMRRRWYGH